MERWIHEIAERTDVKLSQTLNYIVTTEKFLTAATNKLKKAGIGTARLDALVLLEDATGKDRAWLLAHPEFPIAQGPTLSKLNEQIERRTTHVPLAYVRGKTEFYGREFIISKDVLEPRPESETMIELLKELVSKTQKIKKIIDIGTGSGALAITAKLEIPDCEVVATDIDSKCLKVARQNTRKHKIKIKLYSGDLLLPARSLLTPESSLLCNLPYVPDSHTINQAAMNEPRHAIFGGPDGLDLYRQLFKQLSSIKYCPGLVFTESLPFQHQKLSKIARAANYRQLMISDFIQVFKNKTQ